MMSDEQAVEMFRVMLVQMPLDQMTDVVVQMVRAMGDRIDAEYPDDATSLRDAADRIEGVMKVVKA